MRFHFFHQWTLIGSEHRECSVCNRMQGYCAELGGWRDIDFLATSIHDKGRWLGEYIRIKQADETNQGETK